MDSREMFNATAHLTPLVTWDKDWIHVGTEHEIKFELLERLIEDHLTSRELLFICERTTSGQHKKEEIIEFIKSFLGRKSFQLWTEQMDKVIQFERIGVLHLGYKMNAEFKP